MRSRSTVFTLIAFFLIGFLLAGDITVSDFFVINKSGISVTPEEFRQLEAKEQYELLEELGGEYEYERIESMVKKAYSDQPPDAHELSHKLGEMLIEKRGLHGFADCDSFLNFGCYHGAALYIVARRGPDPSLGDELWKACKEATDLPERCLHGLGHAIMVINDYDLMKSYEECERIIEDENDSFWCEDGATMEGLSRTMAADKESPYEGLEDPYYPCRYLPVKYHAVCARNHVGFVGGRFNYDTDELVDYCQGYIRKEAVSECVEMVANIKTKEIIDDNERILSLCRSMDGFLAECVNGAVSTLTTSRRYEQVKHLCESIDTSLRSECLKRVESIKKFL